MGVGGQNIRARRCEANDRDRGRIDVDSLKMIEVGSERIREDGFDEVAMTHGHPDGPRSQSRFEAGIVGSDGMNSSSMHLAH